MLPKVEGGWESGFGLSDWAVVLGLLVATTWLGGHMAGKQTTLRDYFLGGRRLPWYAVSASIIATEISAVTFISFPAVVAKAGGNFTYLQIGLIGSLIAKGVIGWLLVPAYYEREIYSPYDFMGNRLGAAVRTTATLLFSLGGVLGQAARVYLTAIVLEVLLYDELVWVQAHTGLSPLVSAVSAIGLVAVAWTWMGGIATVVWTDMVLFGLFLVGIAVALWVAISGVEGGAGAVLESAREADKLRLLDFSTDPTRAYTFWAALIASSWGMVGSYGTDQLMAQRLFCCANVPDARRAIISSYGAMVVTCLVGVVGLALYAYYAEHPLAGEARALVEARGDRLFPVFVVQAVPSPLKGLIVAGAFAAAISSLDSILAALSQTTLSALYLPWRAKKVGVLTSPEEERRTLRVSRALVILAALLLCGVAVLIDEVATAYDSILELALAMTGYTGGALIAGFFMALLPLRADGSGFPWSASLSVLTVFAITSRQEWAQRLPVDPATLCLVLGALGFALWLALRVRRDLAAGVNGSRLLWQSGVWAIGLVLVVVIARVGYFERDGVRVVLAWPWYLPIGSLVAFSFGVLLARPRGSEELDR